MSNLIGEFIDSTTIKDSSKVSAKTIKPEEGIPINSKSKTDLFLFSVPDRIKNKIDFLIKQLDSEGFGEREKAEKELKGLLEITKPNEQTHHALIKYLYDQARETRVLEIKHRILDKILPRFKSVPEIYLSELDKKHDSEKKQFSRLLTEKNEDDYRNLIPRIEEKYGEKGINGICDLIERGILTEHNLSTLGFLGIANSRYATPKALAILSNSKNDDVKVAVAGNRNTDLQTLQKLAKKNEHWKVRMSVAGNENTDVPTLQMLAEDKDENIRTKVAESEKIDPLLLPIFELLAKDKSIIVRTALAKNRYMDKSIFKSLALDEDKEVRAAIACNEKTDIGILQMLAGDKDSSVKMGVAGNGSTDELTLQKLAKDEYWKIRYVVAMNKNTDKDTLGLLATKDENKDVRTAAKETLDKIRGS